MRFSAIDVVATHQKTQQGLKLLAAIRIGATPFVATHQKTQQGLKLLSATIALRMIECRNASENPTGIETISWKNT